MQSVWAAKVLYVRNPAIQVTHETAADKQTTSSHSFAADSEPEAELEPEPLAQPQQGRH